MILLIATVFKAFDSQRASRSTPSSDLGIYVAVTNDRSGNKRAVRFDGKYCDIMSYSMYRV